MSEVGFSRWARPAAPSEVQPIGVGMLGYAFMGKAHSNAYKTLAYMTWPPPLMPQLVSIAGRNEEAVSEAARRYGFAEHVTDWHALVADDRVQLFDNFGPEQPPRRAHDRRGRGRQARDLREAAGARRRRVATRPGSGSRPPASSTCAPSTTASCRRCGSRARSSSPASSARSRTSAAPTCRSGAPTDDDALALRQGRRRVGSAGRSRRARDRPGPLPGRRDRLGGRADRDLPAGQGGRRRGRGGRRLRGRRRGHDRGHALRLRPQERLPLGDQRLQGLARLRPRAAQRAAVLRGHEGLPHRAGLRGRPPVLGALVAARPHHRLGAHLRARAAPPAHRHPRRRRRGAARRHARGRLPRRRGVRRDAAVRGGGRA